MKDNNGATKFTVEDYYGSVITMAFTRSGRCTVLAAVCVAIVTLAACGQSAPRAVSRLSATAPPSTTSTAPTISKSAPPPLTTTITVLPPKPSSTPKSTSTTSTRPLPPGALRLPSPHPFAAASARSGGVDIVTDAKHECVWLQRPDGKKLAALWPPDHYALFDPLRVFDGTGREIWREGQLRAVGGPAEGISNIPKRCRVGDVAWLAPGEPDGFA